jgi:hypothetical protein
MYVVEEILWRNSPQYAQAYQEGYEQSKLEMLEKLKQMQALSDTSSTVST